MKGCMASIFHNSLAIGRSKIFAVFFGAKKEAMLKTPPDC